MQFNIVKAIFSPLKQNWAQNLWIGIYIYRQGNVFSFRFQCTKYFNFLDPFLLTNFEDNLNQKYLLGLLEMTLFINLRTSTEVSGEYPCWLEYRSIVNQDSTCKADIPYEHRFQFQLLHLWSHFMLMSLGRQ